jgi:enoyl-CoA hydratase/carnithine racemase
MASDLIDATASTSLEDGLQLELDGLHTIFSTKDALEGLSALIENRRPTYTNE